MKLSIFRTYGVGTSVDSAFKDAIDKEGDLELAKSLSDMNIVCKEIIKPEGIDSSELELKLFTTCHAEQSEKKRKLTSCESKAKEWFYDHYKEKAPKYLQWYRNKIKNKKCVAISFTPKERAVFNEYYPLKENEKVYRFVGHA
jgi:hypothetical protein